MKKLTYYNETKQLLEFIAENWPEHNPDAIKTILADVKQEIEERNIQKMKRVSIKNVRIRHCLRQPALWTPEGGIGAKIASIYPLLIPRHSGYVALVLVLLTLNGLRDVHFLTYDFTFRDKTPNIVQQSLIEYCSFTA